MNLLHLLKVMVNPWRVPYFENILRTHHVRALGQVRVLDIGCGGGILTEEFARMGCKATGIDVSSESDAVARAHAAVTGLSIDYMVGSGTSLPFAGHHFDVVSCCDVLEQIRDWRQVIAEAERVLQPGGLFLFDTINRTLKSKAVMIYGLQELALTRLMPRDTHLWAMFITPDEMSVALRQQGMMVGDLKGGSIAISPLAALWHVRQQKQGRITFAELGRRLGLTLGDDVSLNYLGYARKGV